MADKSNIEWTDATWNPIVGCSIVSPGCTNCYAMKMAARIERMRAPERRGDVILPHHYTALTEPSKGGPVWTGRVNISPDHILTQPLRWKRGRKIFVNSMGDLFHESIPDEWIDRVFAVMALCPQHTFQVLTKRADRMRDYLTQSWGNPTGGADGLPTHLAQRRIWGEMPRLSDAALGCRPPKWPLPNVWLGVSTERQKEADERIPLLLQTPAAVRFISAEPLLGPIDLAPKADSTYQRLSEWYGPNGFDPTGSQPRRERMAGFFPRIDWVIVGGESGSNARLMHPQWARTLRDQCAAAGTRFFFKQWGEFAPTEISVSEWLHQRDPRRLGERIAQPDGTFAGFPAAGGARAVAMRRVGKANAGRLLDGREHNEFPSVARAKAA